MQIGDKSMLHFLEMELDTLQVRHTIVVTCAGSSTLYPPLIHTHIISNNVSSHTHTQKLSNARLTQLREMQSLITEICNAIMWVNEKEEVELVFDWGDKNIDTYIPPKQESYSVLTHS